MTVRVLTTCHTQYTSDSSECIFYLTEQHSKFLLHTLQVLYMCTVCDSTNINTIICTYTGLFKMTVRVLTTCHTQYTSDSSECIFYLTEQHSPVFVTYLTGALYVRTLWFYKHQHDNPVRSKLSVACQRWWFQWRFWFLPSVPGYLREEEEHKPDPWRNTHREKSHGVAFGELVGKLLKPWQSFRITLYFVQKLMTFFVEKSVVVTYKTFTENGNTSCFRKVLLHLER